MRVTGVELTHYYDTIFDVVTSSIPGRGGETNEASWGGGVFLGRRAAGP
jgi:hypothetical protein